MTERVQNSWRNPWYIPTWVANMHSVCIDADFSYAGERQTINVQLSGNRT